jgi:hypothetical protein
MVALPNVPQREPGLDPLALGIKAARAAAISASSEVRALERVAMLSLQCPAVALEAGRLGGAGDRERGG